LVLGLVSPGDAKAIVTGDKDLLVLGRFKGASTEKRFFRVRAVQN
jgi:predicted nucleic acid-binding protein